MAPYPAPSSMTTSPGTAALPWCTRLTISPECSLSISSSAPNSCRLVSKAGRGEGGGDETHVVLGGVCRDLIINLESSLVVQQHRWDRPAARGGIEAAKESVTHGGDVGVLAGVIAHVKHRHHCFKLQSSSRVRVPHWDHAAHL